MGGRYANMFDKRTSIDLKIIANMHKALDKWLMVGIRIIHDTKYSEMSKHMGQVQDNPSIMCIWCSEDIMALNTEEGAIVQYV